MSDSNSQISEGRQGLYYAGMALSVIGVILFLSVFLSAFGAASSGSSRSNVRFSPGSENFLPPGFLEPGDGVTITTDGVASRRNSGPNPMTALWGMGFIAVGGVMMNIGRAGMRGSGVILDPHGAREDLKPWNQAAGGMLDDTLAASPIVSRAVENLGEKNEPLIRVRCGSCRALNDEDAKFCDECGAKL